jgi:sigma-B regulation protein RsbU (phosphoserine phosphatase)
MPAAAPPVDRRSTGRPVRLFSVGTWPAPLAALACALLLGVIVTLDLTTGPQIELSPLYFLPIIVASLRFQAPGGLAGAAVSAPLATWFSPESMSRVHSPHAFLTNAVTLWVSFSFVALVTGALQQHGEQLRRQRRTLEEAHRLLQEDLRAAELVQTGLLRRPLPAIPGLQVAVEIRFARGVGGDFYDLRQVGGRLSLCVADVSGKGAQAALISAALRILLDEVAAPGAHEFAVPEPARFLRHLNTRLSAALPRDMFVTLFYGQLDLETGELRYASAGHDPPFLCGREAVRQLPPTTAALGILEELPERSERVTLQPGETLVLYTDGLTTARHPAEGRIGEERVIRQLQLHRAAPPAELVAALRRLACPDDETAADDDVAVLALRRDR